jgi:hypothetical protein
MMRHRPSHLDEAELRKAAPPAISSEEAVLALGLLAAPLAWALHLTLSYGLIYPAERWQSKAVLFLTSGLAVVLALGSLAVGRWGLRRAASGRFADAAQGDRTRFLARCAYLAGGFFLLGIVAQSVPLCMLALGAVE